MSQMRPAHPSAEYEIRAHDLLDSIASTVPSLNYALFDPSGILDTAGYGSMRLQMDNPRCPDLTSVHRIASMSKSFCAAAVLLLEQRGLLNMADPVAKHVPAFHTSLSASSPVPITVHMLLSNSSGLPEDNAWADRNLGLTVTELDRLVEGGLVFGNPAGMEYQYSNVGFGILGRLVELVSNTGYVRFVTEEFLTPLGLHSTRFHEAAYVNGAIAHGYVARSEKNWIDCGFEPTGALACSGSMFSTLEDMARWSTFLSSGFSTEREWILSSYNKRRMQTLQTAVPSTNARQHRPDLDNFGYGLGLFVEHDPRFGSVAQHSGALPGFASNFRWHCSTGIGVVVFVGTSGVPVDRWTADLLRLALNDMNAAARITLVDPDTERVAAFVDEVIVNHRSFAELKSVAANNFFEDHPADSRQQELDECLDRVGGINPSNARESVRVRSRCSIANTHLRWTISGRVGDLICDIELTPFASVRQLQKLTIHTAETADISALIVGNHLSPAFEHDR